MQVEKMSAQQKAYIIAAAGTAGATGAALKIMGETASYSARAFAVEEPAEAPWQKMAQQIESHVGSKPLRKAQAFMVQEQGVSDIKRVLGSRSFEQALDNTMERSGQTAGDILNELMMEKPGALRSLVQSVKDYMGAHELTKMYTGEVNAQKTLLQSVSSDMEGSPFYKGAALNVLKTVTNFIEEAKEAGKSMSIEQFLDQYAEPKDPQGPSVSTKRKLGMG